MLFSCFEGTRRDKNQIFRTLEPPDKINMFVSSGFKIPLKLNEFPPIKKKECEVDGMSWVSDFIAFRMKKVQDLGVYEFKATNKHTKNKLRTLLNRHCVQICKKYLKSF